MTCLLKTQTTYGFGKSSKASWPPVSISKRTRRLSLQMGIRTRRTITFTRRCGLSAKERSNLRSMALAIVWVQEEWASFTRTKSMASRTSVLAQQPTTLSLSVLGQTVDVDPQYSEIDDSRQALLNGTHLIAHLASCQHRRSVRAGTSSFTESCFQLHRWRCRSRVDTSRKSSSL